MQDIIAKLTSKDDKYACAVAEKIISESQDTDEWYEYFDTFVSLLNHPKSLVRNRVLYILAANAQWDDENRFDAILPEFLYRLNIPIEIQGRVFAARNSFRFFTIPLGYFLGGLLVDQVFEPIMAMQETDGLLVKLFGYGKGSGAAFLFAVLWLAGIAVCLIFRTDKHIWKLEKELP